MTQIEPNSVATFSVLFIFFLMALFIIGYLLVKWGKKSLKNDNLNELKYKLEYREIQYLISTLPVDIGMYYRIKRKIEKLERFEYQNPEKTAGLYVELVSGRFLKIADGIAKNRLKNK